MAEQWQFEETREADTEGLKADLALVAIRVGIPNSPDAWADVLNALRELSPAKCVYKRMVSQNDPRTRSLDRLEVGGAVATRFDPNDPRVRGFTAVYEVIEIAKVREALAILCRKLKKESAIAMRSASAGPRERLRIPRETIEWPILVAVTQNLQRLLLECGWSREDLAEKLEMERGAVIAFCIGRSCPPHKTLKKCAHVFTKELGRSVTIRELLTPL
jgi:DNA-binding XRE family transcriptional regulator